MTRYGRQLKSSGWFAAGAEVRRAATLLTDGAFKLFVWLCLHADCDRGSLRVTLGDLATAILKTEDDIASVWRSSFTLASATAVQPI